MPTKFAPAPTYGPEPTTPMIAHAVKLENDARNRGPIFTQKPLSFSESVNYLTGKVRQGNDSWNKATAIPIPPKFVGGTPEFKAAGEQLGQDFSRAASDLGSLASRDAWNDRIEPVRNRVDQIRSGVDQVRDAFAQEPGQRQNLSPSQAAGLVSRGPDQKQTVSPAEASQYLTQDKSGMSGAALPEVFGPAPTPTPANTMVPALPPWMNGSPSFYGVRHYAITQREGLHDPSPNGVSYEGGRQAGDGWKAGALAGQTRGVRAPAFMSQPYDSVPDRATASQSATLLPVLFGRSAGVATPEGQQPTAAAAMSQAGTPSRVNDPSSLYPGSENWDRQPGWLARGINANRVAQGLAPYPTTPAATASGTQQAGSSGGGNPTAGQSSSPSLTELARDSKDPREAIASAALQGNPGGQYSPAAWEAIQNPDMARLAPGEKSLPGRENLDLRQPGQPDFRSVGVNPVAPQNPWQPNLGGKLPSDDQLAMDAAQRKFSEARNNLMGLTMQEAGRAKYGAKGRVFERTGDPGDYAAYLTAANASREAAARGDAAEAARLSPGAWQGWTSPSERKPNADGSMYAGPARSTWDMLSPEQKTGIRARQQARADNQAIRQQMVTARAQGRSISPAEAAVEHLMARNQQLSPEQKMLAFGQPYIAAEGQRQAAEQAANAEIRKAEIGAETERAKLDPEVMRMAAIQQGLGNLPKDATMADVNRLTQALRPQGNEQPLRSGPFSGMTQQQAETAVQLSKDPAALRNYLFTIPGVADEERINQILQSLSGYGNADIAHPGGSSSVFGVLQSLGRFFTGK